MKDTHQKKEGKENLEELEQFSKNRKLQNKILKKMVENLSKQVKPIPKNNK